MGFYSVLEDKWYSAIDKIDKFIPVGKVVDKVDTKIPSFILFLVVILVIVLLILFLTNPIKPIYDVEVVVLSNNLPLANTLIEYYDSCEEGNLTTLTNSAGKAHFTICDGYTNVVAKKEGYNIVTRTLTPEDRRVTISLSPKPVEEKNFTLLVMDTKKNMLEDVDVQLLCDGTKKENVSGQPQRGFVFIFEYDCVFPQLKITSEGFVEKTVTIQNAEERKVVYLDEINLKGTLVLNTINSLGVEPHVEVVTTNEFGKVITYFTDNSGNKKFDVAAGEYSYSAISENTGEIKTGTFEIVAGGQEIVTIEFSVPVEEDDKKYFAFKVVDTLGQPLSSASVRLFKDGTNFATRYSNSKGKTTPIPLAKSTITAGINYKGVISLAGHTIKLFDIVLQDKDNFQQVVMESGGAKIKARILDDTGKAERRAFVTIKADGFAGILASGESDSNGVKEFDYLPGGTYIVSAIDKAQKDEAQGKVTVGKNGASEITLILTTGEGKITFDFIDPTYGKVEASYIFRNFDSGTILGEGITTRGSFRSGNIKKGTKVQIVSNKEEYFYHESLIYGIDRGSQTKDVFVREQNDLPNQKEVQMFLMEIYGSNPLYGKVSNASRIEPGESYYLYFDLILNNEDNGTILADFEIENDSDKGITIENIYSIDGYQRVLVSARGNKVIDRANNQFIVDSKALQGNLLLSNQQGKKSIPIIVELFVDQNAEVESKTILHFNSLHNEKESLAYSKEILIGEKFCLDDCPAFLFSNYLKWGDRDYQVLDEDVVEKLLIGDPYLLKTSVRNLTDEAIGASKLILTIPKEKLAYLTVEDTNSKSFGIVLNPLEKSDSFEAGLVPLKKTYTGAVFQKVSKEVNAIDKLIGYEGSNKSLRFKILEKEELSISISPEKMNEGTREFFFVIKTKYKSKYGGIPAYWYVTKNGERLGTGYEGATDENGIQIVTLDGTAFEEGDEVIFTAYDNNGAIEGTFNLEIDDPFIEEVPLPPECITINFAGSNINTVENPLKTLNKMETTNLEIVSSCAEERRVFIHTDLLLSNNTFPLDSNETQNITITAKPRGDLLGIYPVQIISIEDSDYRTLGIVDVEIRDPTSDFNLSKVIFDLKNDSKGSGVITNSSFAGRKDNYNPQVSISTQSVSLQYRKPGNPESIDLNIPITGTAIESITVGATKSHQISAIDTGHAWYEVVSAGVLGWYTWVVGGGAAFALMLGDTKATVSRPAEMFATDQAMDLCERQVYAAQLNPKPEPEPPERIINAIVLPTASQTLPDEGSTGTIITEEESGELSAKKEKKVSFAGGYLEDYGPTSGEVGQLTPGAMPITDTTKIPNTAPSERGSYHVEFMWASKYHDAMGNATNGADSGPSDVGYYGVEKLYGDRCEKYKANDPYWRYTPWGNFNDAKELYYKVNSFKSAGGNTKITLGGNGKVEGDSEWIDYYNLAIKPDCSSGLSILDCETSSLSLQLDHIAVLEHLTSIEETVHISGTINPIEDTVYDLGRYKFSLTPVWTDVDTTGRGNSVGDTEEDGLVLHTVNCIVPNGFVDWEHAASVGRQGADGCESMPIRPIILPASDPLVEYSPNGLIRYWVHPLDDPEDVNIYLYKGRLYAEYIGIPEIASPNIDFNLTKNNLLGTEYAVMTVKDWVQDANGEFRKDYKLFQVKLIGNEHNVYASDGTPGVTGSEFVPRLLFDWDWDNISYNQCDSENNNYTYCDGVQFNISLFKRLSQVEDLLLQNKLSDIPEKTAFYTYLIKDNYNSSLLNDFLDYYETHFLAGGTTFSRLKNLIKENKLEFKVNNANNTLLPYGGLYRVEIDIQRENENLYSLFNGDEVNATVVIHLIPIEQAKNYNPLYEMPFDGDVGDQRNGYGVGGNNLLKLSETVIAKEASGALKLINYFTSTDPAVTDTGIVLDYDATTNDFVFVPSQPTPVEVTITRDVGNAYLNYSLVGTGANNLPAKTWKLKSSTIGGIKCHDFEDVDKQTFTETKENETHTIAWNAIKDGAISLTTTFLTPKSPVSKLRINPVDEATNVFNSYENLVQSTSVFLSNYDDQTITDYDTLNGLFRMIKEEKMAISMTSTKVKIFWNPDYLAELEETVETNSGHSCN